jgi:periplasmic protein TonB
MAHSYSGRPLHVVPLFAVLCISTSSAQSPRPSSGTAGEEVYRAGQNGVSMLSCIDTPAPVCTKQAKDAKVEGIVLVEGVINLNGTIARMKVLKGLGSRVEESAMKTLKKGKCKPGNGPEGQPLPTIVAFELRFRLD